MGKYDYLVSGGAKTSTKSKYDFLIPEKKEKAPVKSVVKRGGVLGGLQELVGDITETVRAPFPKQSFNPKEALKTYQQTTEETLKSAGERNAEAYFAVKDPSLSLLEKTTKIGEAGMGTLGALFLPITAPLQGAAKLPVVGSAAEIINRFFGVLGVVGEDAMEGAVEALPISDKSKETITPLAKEVGALAAQIAGGKAGADVLAKVKAKSQNLAAEIDKGVMEKGAVTPEVAPEAPTTPKTAPETTIVPKVGAKVVPNTRAQTLEKAAVEKKLTDSLGELPTHERMSMTDQASRAVDFINKSPEEALRVVRGEKVPDGILPEAIYTALEIKAIKEGDVAMLKELSKSTIPTSAGQALKALDSVDPNSPVKIMRDIQGFREAKAEKKTGKKKAQATKDVVLEIKKEVQKSVSKRQSWESFIKEIQCK